MSARPRPRLGATLVETLVTLALTPLVVAAIAGLLVAQRRGAQRVAEDAATDAQLESGLLALASELRSLAAGDLHVDGGASPSIELRSLLGGGIACDRSGDEIAIVGVGGTGTPPTLAGAPGPGDTLWALVESPDPPRARWIALAVDGSTTRTGRCRDGLGARLAGTDPAGVTRTLVVRTRGAPPTIAAGTAVRLTRWTRWMPYLDARGDWQLGTQGRSGPAGRWEVIQPVSGPLRPPTGEAAGFTVALLDSLGGELAAPDAERAARLRLALRGSTTDGRSRERVVDVRLRNASPVADAATP
jgi:hypothetical protein